MKNAGASAIDSGTSAVDSGTSAVDSGIDGGPSGSDSGAGTVAPTTCAQAHEKAGCCVGNDLYYCNGTTAVTMRACTGGEVCGWLPAKAYYDCVAPPASADPSGAYPMTCP